MTDDLLADRLLDWEERFERGEDVPAEELLPERPDLVPELAERIDRLRRVAWVARPVPDDEPSEDTQATPPGGPARPGGESGVETECGPVWADANERYRLDELIGEGGFGRVWRGFDVVLNRPVAVKLPRHGRTHPGAGDAFLDEARQVARLAIPGVVPVYDVGRRADGATFIVSELVDGTDLAQRLRTGPLAAREAVRVVAEVARHLHQVHSQNYVHRDLKPANILLGRDGRVLVTDFGIAVSADDPDGAADGAGTLAYMAPEQLSPDRSRVDARTDVYALGVVLYKALTGRLPFPATSPDDLRSQIVGAEPAPPRSVDRSVPAEVDRVVMKCLAKSPADRYPSAEALADDLDRWLRRGRLGRLVGRLARPSAVPVSIGRTGSEPAGGFGVDATSGEGGQPDGRPPSQARRRLLLAACLLFGAAGLAGVWASSGSGDPGRPGDEDSTSLQTPPPAHTKGMQPGTPDGVPLFNGRDLTGWTPHCPGALPLARDTVTVRDGTLAARPHMALRVCTDRAYKDFTLRMEYRHPPGGAVTFSGGLLLLRGVGPTKQGNRYLRVKLRHQDGGVVILPDQRRPDGNRRVIQVHLGSQFWSTVQRPPPAAGRRTPGGQGCVPWTTSPAFGNCTATA